MEGELAIQFWEFILREQVKFNTMIFTKQKCTGHCDANGEKLLKLPKE